MTHSFPTRRSSDRNALVIEKLGHRQPPLVVGARIEFGEAFVDAAIFAGQNLLNLLGSQRGHHALEIAGEAGRDVERLAIAPRAMDVEQAREYFVDGIEWRPRAVEVETDRKRVV